MAKKKAKTKTIQANIRAAKKTELLAIANSDKYRPLRINDTSIDGFYLQLNVNGSASWYLQKRIAGDGRAPKSFKLASAWGGKVNEPTLPAKQAANKAIAWSAICADGQNPREVVGSDADKMHELRLEQRDAEKGRPKVMFEQLADYYLKKKMSASHKVSATTRIRKYLSWLHGRDVSQVTSIECKDQYEKCLEELADRGLTCTQARQSFQLFGTMWNYGQDRFCDSDGNAILGENPISRMKTTIVHWAKNPNPIQPHFDVDNVGQLIANMESRIEKLNGVPGHIPYNERSACQILLLCLFTGMRVGEARHLLWDGVNLESGELRLGKIRDEHNREIALSRETKNGKNHCIQLSLYPLKLLKKLHEERSNWSPYVFPKWNHPMEPRPYRMGVIQHICKDMGIYFRSHAMRRTFRGVCRHLRIDPDETGRMLNHRHKGDVTDGYDSGFNPRLRRQFWREVANFLEEKRDLYLGKPSAGHSSVAQVANFLEQNGLSHEEGLKILKFLNGQAVELESTNEVGDQPQIKNKKDTRQKKSVVPLAS